MRGRAVPTTVWSNEARNIVSRIAPRIVNFARGGSDISDGAAALGSGTTCCAAGGRRSSMAAMFLVLCQPLSVGQQLQREVPELNEFVTGESICERELELQSGPADRVDSRPPSYRKPRLDRATIVGVGYPLHQPRSLQAVDEPRDVARADVLQRGQVAEADAAVAEVAEHEKQLQPALT